MWMNIWIVVIEFMFAGLLWSFRYLIAVRMISVFILLYGLMIWIFAENMGRFFAPFVTFLAGSPGAGLLLAVTAAFLLLQLSIWRSKLFYRGLIYGNAIYWLSFLIFQWISESGFWTALGYKRMLDTHPVHTPRSLYSIFIYITQFGIYHPVLLTMVLGMTAIILVLLWSVLLWNENFLRVTTLSSVVVLMVMWVIFQSAGFRGEFALALGSEPLVTMWSILPLLLYHYGAKHRVNAHRL